MILNGLLYLILSGAPQLPAGAMPQNPPPAIMDALRAAAAPIGFAGKCTDMDPKMIQQPETERREKRYLAALDDAVGVWGGRIEQEVLAIGATTFPACSRKNVSAALYSADKALAAEAALFDDDTRAMAKGAWIGTLHLCRSQVVSAGVSLDHRIDAARLDIELVPAARPVLARLSADAIDRHPAVRLDGVVVVRPYIGAVIADGELYLVGPDKAVLERLGAAMTAPC